MFNEPFFINPPITDPLNRKEKLAYVNSIQPKHPEVSLEDIFAGQSGPLIARDGPLDFYWPGGKLQEFFDAKTTGKQMADATRLGLLDGANFSLVYPHMFSGQDAKLPLYEFAHTAGLEDIAQAKLLPFQFGVLDIIIGMLLKDHRGKPAEGVIQLSRGSLNPNLPQDDIIDDQDPAHGLAIMTVWDRKALELEAANYAKRTEPDFRRAFSVVPPYSHGVVRIPGNNNGAPYYITPFIQRQELTIGGKLVFDQIQNKVEFGAAMIPFFLTAIDWNELLSVVNAREVNASANELLINHLVMSPSEQARTAPVIRYQERMRVLYDFMAGLYLLTGGQLPTMHDINAGDHIFNGNDGSFTMITNRGKLVHYKIHEAIESLSGSESVLRAGRTGPLHILNGIEQRPDGVYQILRKVPEGVDVHVPFFPYSGTSPNPIVPIGFTMDTEREFLEALKRMRPHIDSKQQYISMPPNPFRTGPKQRHSH